MGCGGSKGSVVDQNQNHPPSPQQQPQKQPLPQVQSQPKQAPVQPVAPQPRQPPPPPKAPTPPPQKEPTPPPPKEPSPPPPKEPTSPPPVEETEKLTPEVLKEFASLEKSIQKLEKVQPEERLMLIKFELKHTEDSVKTKESELDAATSVAMKEYADYANFNVQEYMTSNHISYLSQQDADAAFNKEKQEYLEAKNKVDSFKKEVDRLNAEIVSLNGKLTDSTAKVNELQSLQDKQDGLLENLFNGDYGSELEDKLEAEHEELRSKRDQLVLVAMKWRSCKDALSKACSQLAYSAARWNQIKEYPNIPNVAKYYMATETRDRLIGGHMNIRHCMEQIQMKLPYWNDSDDKNLVMSVNIIYNDITTQKTFERALAWYKYYHWRAALGLNWVEQVLNQLHQQVGDAEKSVREKYTELKKERLQCIQAKLKETMDVDFNIEELMNEEEGEDEEDPLLMSTIFDVSMDTQESVEEMPAPKENENPTSLESFVADADMPNEPEGEAPKESSPEGEDVGKPEETASTEETGVQAEEGEKPEADANESESKPAEDKPKAPPIKTIPLEDLAPLPSQDELLGKVEKLLASVENAEETLEKNKLKQEQQLQEQLRRRRSRRKRMADQAKNNVQVNQTETIPESEEPKPESDAPKPESEEPKPETDEPKPESDEPKPDDKPTETQESKPE